MLRTAGLVLQVQKKTFLEKIENDQDKCQDNHFQSSKKNKLRQQSTSAGF